MPVTDDSQYGGQSDAWANEQATTAAPGPGASQSAVDKSGLTTEEKTALAREAALNNQKVHFNPDGSHTLVPMTPQEVTQNQAQLQAQQQTDAGNALLDPATQGPGQTVDRTDPAAGVQRPVQTQTAKDLLQTAGPVPGQPQPVPIGLRPAGTRADIAANPVDVSKAVNVAGQTSSPTPTPVNAPKLDTTHIDSLLQGVNAYASQIAGLAGDNTGLSAALAQLQRGLEATRSQALSLSRSGGARGRYAAEHQALTEGAAAGSQATLDAATVRAAEEDNDRRFKLDALKEAAGLGLNTSALELDISKVNSANVMDIVNQEFQQLGIDKQLSQQEADSLRGYARDMSALQFQYDSLSSDEQRFVSDQLLKKYQIDQGLANNLEVARISKPSKVPWWQQVLTTAVGGAATGGAGALTTLAVSDVRAKTAIDWHAEDDLQQLLASIKPAAYRYKDTKDGAGLFWGPMAQDLLRSKLGQALVDTTDPKKYRVDAGRAGLTALGAAAALDERLRRLENG